MGYLRIATFLPTAAHSSFRHPPSLSPPICEPSFSCSTTKNAPERRKIRPTASKSSRRLNYSRMRFSCSITCRPRSISKVRGRATRPPMPRSRVGVLLYEVFGTRELHRRPQAFGLTHLVYPRVDCDAGLLWRGLRQPLTSASLGRYASIVHDMTLQAFK